MCHHDTAASVEKFLIDAAFMDLKYEPATF